MKNIFKVIVVLGLSLVATFSNARISTTPSPAQIEQFKKLPKAQQQALAKQFGIDLSALESVSTSGDSNEKQDAIPEQQYVGADVQQLEVQDSSLKPFGYEMFEMLQDSFLPNGNIPVPADYVIGVGDSLNISLYGKEYQEYNVVVNNDGKITLPNIEPIAVAGLALSEVKDFVADVISAKLFGMKTVISIGDLRSIQVYVLGDVKKPGAYQLSSLSTVSNALFISGGPNEYGSLRNIQLRRAGKDLANLDMYKFMLEGDVSADRRLQQGDVVYVHSIENQVSVLGEVRRPAIYEVKQGESYESVIAFAGGLTSSAYPKSVEVTSYNGDYLRTVNNINLLEAESVKTKAKNGDIIKVHASGARYQDAINLAGFVTRPGKYAWNRTTTLNNIIDDQSDLLLGADSNYGVVIRNIDSIDVPVSIIQFSPAKIISKEQLVKLEKNDLVLFFNSLDKENFYTEQAAIASEFENRKEKTRFRRQENLKVYSTAFEELTAIYGQEGGLVANDKEKLNYLYHLLYGDESDRLDAFQATQSLSRLELLQPVLQLMENKATIDQSLNIVEVRGQVRFPGKYPIQTDSNILDAIAAAGGLNESATLFHAEISRYSLEADDASVLNHISVNLKDAYQGEENKLLKGRDVINIFQQASWSEELKVKLEGEVKYPGVYEFKENETLSDVITRAGGLTSQAFASAAFFTRVKLKQLEQSQARDMAKALNKELALKSMNSTATFNIQEVQSLVSNLSRVEGVGRLIIDLNMVLAGEQDIQLESGDRLVIPRKRNEINIVGEVQVATSHVYNGDWSVEDYINYSGGYRAQADESRVYIIRANGLIDKPEMGGWFSSDKSLALNPGDTIVVPLDAGYTDRLTLWEKATAIFYQATVGIAALLRI